VSAAAEMLAEFHERLAAYDVGLRPALQMQEALALDQALKWGDRRGIARGLADLLYVTYGTALVYGIDLDVALRLVHESNMQNVDADGSLRLDNRGWVTKPDDRRAPDMTAAVR
jgi:predicted HAD superfamily Cof-like phosphohydrolase